MAVVGATKQRRSSCAYIFGGQRSACSFRLKRCDKLAKNRVVLLEPRRPMQQGLFSRCRARKRPLNSQDLPFKGLFFLPALLLTSP